MLETAYNDKYAQKDDHSHPKKLSQHKSAGDRGLSSSSYRVAAITLSLKEKITEK